MDENKKNSLSVSSELLDVPGHGASPELPDPRRELDAGRRRGRLEVASDPDDTGGDRVDEDEIVRARLLGQELTYLAKRAGGSRLGQAHASRGDQGGEDDDHEDQASGCRAQRSQRSADEGEGSGQRRERIARHRDGVRPLQQVERGEADEGACYPAPQKRLRRSQKAAPGPSSHRQRQGDEGRGGKQVPRTTHSPDAAYREDAPGQRDQRPADG